MIPTLTFLRRVAALAIVTVSAHVLAAPAAPPWQGARQMVLVTIDGWDADQGTLRRFAREGGQWVAVGASWPVVIGKRGAAWGLGLQPPRADGPVKREGDNRSPAGVFRIGTAFGYAKTLATAMPYRALGATDWCMDVSGARYYNRIVDAQVVGADAVKGSSEPMRRDIHVHGDQRYRMGFVIDSNPGAKPGAGSCIFGHLWASPTTGTAGCTAMTPESMRSLLGWLRPEDHPVFVLLPKQAYAAVRDDWQLPPLEVGR
ncbi:L,D-transpeptidase family protein [Dyella sp. KRB-257]|uniref:L,D-transpeptidase family protein n=1 Tax=Dyella sp. KRB-257 TaxID=3400915 RepID=UPI003C0EB4F1